MPDPPPQQASIEATTGSPAEHSASVGVALNRILRYRRERGLLYLGIILLGSVILAASIGPSIVGIGADDQNLQGRLMQPGWVDADGVAHWFGTDALGRDVLVRVLIGARYSLFIGVGAVAVALVVGVTIGVMAGYLGGWLDDLTMRLADLQLAFPLVLLAMAIAAILGGSAVNEIAVFAVTVWPIIARTARGSTLVIRESEYVQAARANGAGNIRIAWSHVLPNAMGPIAVIASFQLATVIIYSASLGFLGFGVQPPAPTWGNMMAEGREYLTSAWWVTFFPGVVLVVSAAAVNWIGDGVNELLDPRLRRMSSS